MEGAGADAAASGDGHAAEGWAGSEAEAEAEPGSVCAGTAPPGSEPVPALREDAWSSCAVPTAARRRAMPPSATAASARRWPPLPASSTARAAAEPGRGAEDEAADGVDEGAAAEASRGTSPGATSARAWVVSKVTACKTAGCPAPDPGSWAAWESCSPAVLSRSVAASAEDRARSEKGGSTGCGGSTGVNAAARLATTRARQARKAKRGRIPGKRRRGEPCHRFSLVSSFTTDHVVMPAGN